MKDLPNFIFEVPQGESIKRVEFARPSFKVMKLVSQCIAEEHFLNAGVALFKNTVIAGGEALAEDPQAYAAVCYELYKEVINSMPAIEIEDQGAHWIAKLEGGEVRIAKPSFEVIKLAAKAGNTSKLLAGECYLVEGLPADSPIWKDGISFAALAIEVQAAFSRGLPKVKRITLGEP